MLLKLKNRYDSFSNMWAEAPKRKRLGIFFAAYTVTFLLTFCIAYSPFLIEGTTFVWDVDGRLQHYPILVYLGRSVRRFFRNIAQGTFSVPMYDISLGLGADIIGDLNSLGLNDPLQLLSVFFPTKHIEGLYGFLAIFRLYLSGLSFSYFCYYFKKPALHTLIGTLVYCFSGYGIWVSMRHPVWIVPMIQLPLLLVGLEKVLRRENPYIFIAIVHYISLCEYYHLYMMIILLTLYFIIRFLDLYRSERLKQFPLAVGRSVAYGTLGVGLSALVLFPAVAVFLDGGRSGYMNYNGFYNRSWYRIRLLRFIAPVGNWTDMAFAAIVLLALVMLFRTKKTWLKCLSAAVLAIYLTSIGGFVMNGFQYSSNRWTFGLVLVMSFALVEMLPQLLDLTAQNQTICWLILCVYSGFALSTAAARKTTYILVGVAFLAITVALLSVRIDQRGNIKTSGCPNFQIAVKGLLCLILVIGNVGVNAVYRFAADQGNYIKDFTAVGSETKLLEEAIEREVEPYLLNNPAGRMDSSSVANRPVSDWFIPRMSIYNSVTNGNVIEFWNNIENSGNEQAFRISSTGQQTLATTLLSEKYHVEAEKNVAYVPYGYSLLKKTDNNNLIFENDYALPWGYTYDRAMSYKELDGLNGLERQEAMMQAIALDGVKKTADLTFAAQVLPYEAEYKNCSWEGSAFKVKKANATVKLHFQIPAGSEGYVRLNQFDINGSGQSSFSLTAVCEGVKRTSLAESHLFTWYYGRENYLFNLGYSEEERTELTIIFPVKGTFKLKDIELYALPMNNYVEQVEALRAEPLENIQWGTNKITGTVDLSKDKILCMSIPYSKGWSATVDGEKVEILRGNYMFMAVPLEAGHHDIEFHYCSPGIKLGAVVTCCSIAIVAIIRWKDKKRKSKK